MPTEARSCARLRLRWRFSCIVTTWLLLVLPLAHLAQASPVWPAPKATPALIRQAWADLDNATSSQTPALDGRPRKRLWSPPTDGLPPFPVHTWLVVNPNSLSTLANAAVRRMQTWSAPRPPHVAARPGADLLRSFYPARCIRWFDNINVYDTLSWWQLAVVGLSECLVSLSRLVFWMLELRWGGSVLRSGSSDWR